MNFEFRPMKSFQYRNRLIGRITPVEKDCQLLFSLEPGRSRDQLNVLKLLLLKHTHKSLPLLALIKTQRTV